jgi:hypothetical protein
VIVDHLGKTDRNKFSTPLNERIMKTPAIIETVESKVIVPVSLLEQHVNSMHHALEDDEYKLPDHKKSFSKAFENIFWCTEELEVDGTVDVHLIGPGRHRYYSIPVTTAFLVVCTRGADDSYRMTWNCSLS